MINRSCFAVAALFVLFGCTPDREPATGDVATAGQARSIVTSNYPLYFAATRLLEGIDNAPDVVLPEIDGDPAYWVPEPQQIAMLQSADLIVLNGAGAESWLGLVTLDESRLFDTTAELSERLVPLEDAVQHQHGPEGEHSHGGTAFTTWLDPELYAAQARALGERLVALVPADADRLQQNLASLESDLAALDRKLQAALEPLRERPMLFSHPVYQYLERRYDLDGRSLHWEPDVEPSVADWITLQEIRGGHPATMMIWEDEPLPQTRERLASSGIAVVVFQPVANRPASGDYLAVIRANIGRLDTAP